ncbi:MAG: GNAT family N-acetyltransferase, partial [Candidatus Zixiibacteriota bacterium]
MQIKRYNPSHLDEAAVRRLDGFSLLTSVGFAGLWTAAGGRPVYWTAEINDRVVAVLPGVEHGRGPLKRFQALPDGLYATIVFTDPGDERRPEIARDMLRAMADYGYMKLHISDYFSYFTKIPEVELLMSRTTLVNIAGRDWTPPDRKIQSEIRKAEREGVAVEAFDVDRHFECFMALMRQTEKRHRRRPKYSPEFFRALAALAKNDDRVIWKYVAVGGEAAAAHIYFVVADTVLNWQIYFNK